TLPEFRLLFLFQYAGLQRQRVHLGPHKAAITVLRRTHYRLPAHVETRIYDHRAARLLSERLQDLPVERAYLTAHGLYSRRLVNVGHGRDLQDRKSTRLNSSH